VDFPLSKPGYFGGGWCGGCVGFCTVAQPHFTSDSITRDSMSLFPKRRCI
jgi:hypothetical protein